MAAAVAQAPVVHPRFKAFAGSDLSSGVISLYTPAVFDFDIIKIRFNPTQQECRLQASIGGQL